MKFSSKIEKCELSPIRKFSSLVEDAKKRGLRVFPLNIGQPDVETPKLYFDALRRFDEKVLAYAPSEGIYTLTDAVCSYYDKLGVSLDREDILITSGGSEAFQIVLTCILDDGDEILIPEPFYTNYAAPVKLCGASVCPLPTSPDDGYFYADRERIEKYIHENTRAIFVTSPGNPTGNVLSKDELRLLLDIAKEHDLFFICDEVYREFSYADDSLLSSLQFEGYEENVVVIDSVSKRFSACGARIGQIISKNRELMHQALKCCQCRLSVSTVDQLAAAALYSLPDNYFAPVKAEYRKRRDTMLKKLAEIPGAFCSQPEGAFYLMVKLPVDDAEKLQRFLLEKFDDNGDTVLFTYGKAFYATEGKGKSEARLAYTICCDDIERAMEVLKKGIEMYNRQMNISGN